MCDCGCLYRGSLFSKFVQDLVYILLFKGCIINYTYNIIQQTFYFTKLIHLLYIIYRHYFLICINSLLLIILS